MGDYLFTDPQHLQPHNPQPWQGALLSSGEIRKLIDEKNMVSDYLDLSTQLQPNGFDLRVGRISILSGLPVLGFSLKEAPQYYNYQTQMLQHGYYLVTMAETINLPPDIAAIPMNRTSLFRFGSFIAGGWYDVGYSGVPQTGLFVTTPIILMEDARILQLGFLRVNNQSGNTYNGSYQGV